MATELERFIACMEYDGSDRRPNHELGVWPQTRTRWREESGGAVEGFGWNWFVAEPGLRLDRREYVPVHYGFIPHFDYEILEKALSHRKPGVVLQTLERLEANLAKSKPRRSRSLAMAYGSESASFRYCTMPSR